MRVYMFGLAALLLLLVLNSERMLADESVVDLPPPPDAAAAADFSVAVPPAGDCAGGVCRRPVARAVARAAVLPVVAVRRVGARLVERPLLRRVRGRVFGRVGCCRR